MRDKIFISYSRKDKIWLEKLDPWLKSVVREQKLSFWHDGRIVPGADWREEIESILKSTRIGLLL